MTVYVDDAHIPWSPPHMPHRKWLMNHMFADTVEELHALAESIQIRRAWFQCPPKANWEHYDVTAAKRRKAIKAGAVPISWRDLPAKLREMGRR